MFETPFDHTTLCRTPVETWLIGNWEMQKQQSTDFRLAMQFQEKNFGLALPSFGLVFVCLSPHVHREMIALQKLGSTWFACTNRMTIASSECGTHSCKTRLTYRWLKRLCEFLCGCICPWSSHLIQCTASLNLITNTKDKLGISQS